MTYLKGHVEYVFTLAAHPDGEYIVSCGGDGTVRMWGTTPLALLRERVRSYRETADRWAPIVRQRARSAGRGAKIGRRRLIALVTDLLVARRILEHLGLPAQAPDIAAARPPPQATFGF